MQPPCIGWANGYSSRLAIYVHPDYITLRKRLWDLDSLHRFRLTFNYTRDRKHIAPVDMVAVRDDKVSIIPIGKIHFVYQPCLNINIPLILATCLPKDTLQMASCWITEPFLTTNSKMAINKNLPRYKMMKTNQQTEQQQQQHNCPGVLRSHVHCTRFPNPFFGIPHITTPSQREEKNCRPEPADLHLLYHWYLHSLGISYHLVLTKGLWRHIFDRCTPAYLFENTHGVFLPRKMGEAGLGGALR